MKHSFAIIAYKDSVYLEDCIKSLMDQTVKGQIYISTSTPSVGISTIAKKYGLTVFVNETHKGIADDWSFAYKQAKTKYVTLAHQDDLYDRRYAEKCLDLAEKRTDSVITFTDYFEIINGKERSCFGLPTIKKWMLLVLGTKLSLYFGSPICCPSVMYNKENIGDLKFNSDFSIDLDWEAWLRLLDKGRFTFVNSKLVSHRIHPDAETSAGIKDKRRQTEDKILFTRLWGRTLGNIVYKLYSLSYLFNS